ncbi:MAG TPA: hypothetical protein VJP58_05645 [Candidatus Nitrosocosmicus sp.]|nr:hypothetical protein [Candidatus Nitrosocosmicus sp.]
MKTSIIIPTMSLQVLFAPDFLGDYRYPSTVYALSKSQKNSVLKQVIWQSRHQACPPSVQRK